MQAHRVKAPLFRIRDQPFEVLKRAGDIGLAMAFEYRDIDEIIPIPYTRADMQCFTCEVSGRIQIRRTGACRTARYLYSLLFLHVDQLNAIPGRKVIVSAVFEGFGGLIPDPGALGDHDIFVSAILQKLNDPCYDLRVGGPAERSGGRTYQIRFDRDTGSWIRQTFSEPCL